MTIKNILIAGLPGVGKTTLIQKLSEELRPFRPVGFYTAEIREGGVRKGFSLVSLDGKRGLLAHRDIETPHRVGRYGVDLKSFEDFLGKVPWSGPSTRPVIIDEIGKMECLSEKFSGLVKELLDSEGWLLATIALKGGGLIAEVKKRNDVRIVEVNQRNRDSLVMELLENVKADLTDFNKNQMISPD